jgi:two-component system chemotaxis response regulator CheY
MLVRGGTMLKKVMVVDDSNLIHQLYKMVLMRYRCPVVYAKNGQDGMDKLAQNPDIDIVFVDINMPVMNGLEFVKKVKAIGSYNHIPLVIVSTEGRDGDAERGLALGASGYMKKPFQPSDLHALVEALCPAEGQMRSSSP